MIASLVAMAAGITVGALAWGAYHPNSQLFGRVLGHGSRQGKTVYLTFDDGPNPTATARILEVLAEENVPASFFLVGRHVARFPDLARAVSAAGHLVGNHTNTHVKLHRRGPRRVERELRDAQAEIVAVTGDLPRLFRAPHGYRNPFVGRTARELGYTTVGWSFGVWDTTRPGSDVIRERVRRKLRPGSIILLHDGDGYDPEGDRRQTAEALPGIVRDARAAGYQFRPLTDLLQA